MMHILLVRPPAGPLLRWISPPLGITSLAAYLRNTLGDRIRVSLLDLLPQSHEAKSALVEETARQIIALQPNLVGISFLTLQAQFAYLLAKVLTDAGVSTVAGGIHPTVRPEEARKHFDYVVCGEGEQALLELALGFLDGSREHLIHTEKQSGEILQHPLLSGDRLPTPAWDLIDFNNGYNESIGLKEQQAAALMYSRGCAFSCSFCASANLWKKKIRWRPVQAVADEISSLYQQQGIHCFHFYDDDFLVSRHKATALCETIARLPFHIEWVALATVDSVIRNADLLAMLKETGCRGFDIGIESADDEVLSQVGKRQMRSDVTRAIALLRKNRFPYIEPLMMYFNEGETIDGIAQERSLFYEIKLPSIGLAMHQYATPFPGTNFFHSSKKTGLNFTRNWSDYRTDRVNYLPYSFLNSPFPDIRNLENTHISRLLDWDRVIGGKGKGILAQQIWKLLCHTETCCNRSIAKTAEHCTKELGISSKKWQADVVRITALLAVASITG
jgi:radical SAM superfamily enzyme YgiQ (UPF0313 family)